MKDDNSYLDIQKNYTSDIGKFLDSLSTNKETSSQRLEREKYEEIAAKRDFIPEKQ